MAGQRLSDWWKPDWGSPRNMGGFFVYYWALINTGEDRRVSLLGMEIRQDWDGTEAELTDAIEGLVEGGYLEPTEAIGEYLVKQREGRADIYE